MLLWCSTSWAIDPPEMRAVYCDVYSIGTQSGCDTAIANILSDNINAVFVEVRGRGDAYYYPNREDSTYPNPEPRGELVAISPSNLDALQYFIDRLHNATPRREVHAWLTTYNTWNSSTPPSSPTHVYRAHPEWITEDSAGVTYTYATGAPLDPGIPAVQDYLFNIYMDVVRNYDVDGIHFDYIRLLGADSGYDPVARAQFASETGFTYNPASPGPLEDVYKAWRRDQVARLVQRVHDQTLLEKPWVDVSAFTVNFTDSIENLAQGYNWWVAHDAIDALHPSAYSSTISGSVSDWNFSIGKLAQNGDQNKIPVVCALGDYLLTDPNENADAVITLRSNARVPDGFNFFDYGSLYAGGGAHAANLFDPGGPMDDWADIPSKFQKPGEETTPPNAPASLSVSLVGGVPRITFSRPAAAGDGDLPVHYRLYRGATNPPQLYYANMAMEWWDLDSTQSSFSYDDVAAPGGTWYFAAVSYDDWNNRAVVSAGPVSVAGAEIIIDNGDAGYTKTGSWTAGSYSATAYNNDYEYAGSGGAASTARWTPTVTLPGTYEVFVWYVSGSNRANNAPYTVVYDGGSATVPVNQQTGGGQWNSIGSFDFATGTAGYVELGDNANPSVVIADAVRFVKAGSGSTPVPKEPKPPVVPGASNVTEIVLDSEPTSLDYDDGTGWATSTYSPSGTLHEGSTRYCNAAVSLSSYAVYVIDVPRPGYWAIDGWVRQEQNGLAQSVQFRFVDGSDAVRNTVATLRPSPGTSGWLVNVDGVADSSAYLFDQGRVYVTIYGNSGASEQVQADALRFRLVAPTPPAGVRQWYLY